MKYSVIDYCMYMARDIYHKQIILSNDDEYIFWKFKVQKYLRII